MAWPERLEIFNARWLVPFPFRKNDPLLLSFSSAGEIRCADWLLQCSLCCTRSWSAMSHTLVSVRFKLTYLFQCFSQTFNILHLIFNRITLLLNSYIKFIYMICIHPYKSMLLWVFWKYIINWLTKMWCDNRFKSCSFVVWFDELIKSVEIWFNNI